MMKSNPQELDEKRLSAMKVKILEAEMKNLKTREKTMTRWWKRLQK